MLDRFNHRHEGGLDRFGKPWPRLDNGSQIRIGVSLISPDGQMVGKSFPMKTQTLGIIGFGEIDLR